MPTCPHGYEAGACLICKTLGQTTTEPARQTARIPAGKPEVIHTKPQRRGSILGALLAIVVIVLLGWWILGLLRGIFHLVELAVVGAACAYVGYRVGVFRGRHSRGT